MADSISKPFNECDAYYVRSASGADAKAMLPLIHSHAIYERGKADVSEADLRAVLDCRPAYLSAWVAVCMGELVGYATATIDFSTWTGKHFVHLDCLFVQEEHRGKRIGATLLSVVRTFAVDRKTAKIQWVTPDWNKHAVRFYTREGAVVLRKSQLTLWLT